MSHMHVTHVDVTLAVRVSPPNPTPSQSAGHALSLNQPVNLASPVHVIMIQPTTTHGHIQACVALYMLMEVFSPFNHPQSPSPYILIFISVWNPHVSGLAVWGICMIAGAVGLLSLISEDYHCTRYVSALLYVTCMLYN